jgi:hypothetical protein
MRGATRAWALAAGCIALGLTGCGGGERQDADEPEGQYALEITKAEFPEEQSIAERSTLTIGVRNADTKTVPNVAVTLETAPPKPGGAAGAFAQAREEAGLADPSRPVWILDAGPEGGDTAYTNTWALGPLEAGETRTFMWEVTAVQAGDYTVDYTVAPGLDGKAKLSGTAGSGSFDVTVDDAPPAARVDDDGNVVREKAEESG